MQKLHLLVVVFAFEAGLRVMMHLTKDETGKARYPLLSPIYFIMITPAFYLGAMLFGISGKHLDEGYFFPSLSECSGDNCDDGASNFWSGSMWNIFLIVDFSTISWAAVLRSIPTMIALALFSLIHVPSKSSLCYR